MSFLEKFKDATIGFSGYGRLVRDRAGGFGFLAIILMLVMVVSAVISTIRFRDMLADARYQIAKAPDFELSNGEVKYSGPMPVKQTDAGMTFYLDTTGQVTKESLAGQKNVILIAKTYYYQVDQFGREQFFDFQDPQFQQLSVTKAQVLQALDFNWSVFVPIVYLFIYLFQLGAKALDALILALVALIAASGMKRKIEFGTGYKVGLYAMTLPTIIQWIWPGFSTLSLVGFTVWWGLAILYTVMGVRASFNEDPVID